jgi:hypothetical protein
MALDAAEKIVMLPAPNERDALDYECPRTLQRVSLDRSWPIVAYCIIFAYALFGPRQTLHKETAKNFPLAVPSPQSFEKLYRVHVRPIPFH